MGFGKAFNNDKELEESLIRKYGENKFKYDLKLQAQQEAEEEVKQELAQ